MRPAEKLDHPVSHAKESQQPISRLYKCSFQQRRKPLTDNPPKTKNITNPIDVVMAAIEMRNFLEKYEIKKRGMTAYLVTNGSFPDAVERLIGHEPTQFYVTLAAPYKELFDKTTTVVRRHRRQLRARRGSRRL